MDSMFQAVKPLITEEDTDPLTGNIIGAAIEVHRSLGPGLKDGIRRMHA